MLFSHNLSAPMCTTLSLLNPTVMVFGLLNPTVMVFGLFNPTVMVFGLFNPMVLDLWSELNQPVPFRRLPFYQTSVDNNIIR